MSGLKCYSEWKMLEGRVSLVLGSGYFEGFGVFLEMVRSSFGLCRWILVGVVFF